MALIRWRPMRDLFPIQDEINRMFEDISGPQEGDSRITRHYPAADIIENKDSFQITAELPGLSRDEVKITLQNNILTISGEKKRENEEKGKGYHRVERSYGMFSRTFELPVPVDSLKIRAEFQDGILMVDLPKIEEAKAKEIAINIK